MEFSWKVLLIVAACSGLIGQSFSQKTEDDYMRELKRGVRLTRRIMVSVLLIVEFFRFIAFFYTGYQITWKWTQKSNPLAQCTHQHHTANGPAASD